MALLFAGAYLVFCWLLFAAARKPRSAGGYDDSVLNSVEHIWGTTTVAVGDTAVVHCSFDALFQQLRNGNIDWVKELSDSDSDTTAGPDDTSDLENPIVIATGKTLVINDRRYRVYRPHNSALSVLIIRRVRKQDAGVFRCNLAGSTTRHKFMILNITDSKIEAQTSPAETRVKVDSDVTLWCNATGYPIPVVYWTREDRNRKLPDGSYQYWGNGLQVKAVTEYDTGIYVCYLDNFVQPVVTYKFSVLVEDNPWKLDGYKMRFDSSHWFPASTVDPIPIKGKSFLLMCETRGSPKPPPTISWYRSGEPVTNGKHYYIIDDSSDWRQNFVSSTLVIMRYSSQFEGRYVCVASNGFRLRKQKFHVTDSEEVPFTVPSNRSRNNEKEGKLTAQAPVRGSLSNRIAEEDAKQDAKAAKKPEDTNELPHHFASTHRSRSKSENVTSRLKPDDERSGKTSEDEKSRSRSDNERSKKKSDDEKSKSRSDSERSKTTSEDEKSRSRSDNERSKTTSEDEKSRSRSHNERSRTTSGNERSRTTSGYERSRSRTTSEDERSRKRSDGKSVTKTEIEMSKSRTEEERSKSDSERSKSEVERSKPKSRDEKSRTRTETDHLKLESTTLGHPIRTSSNKLVQTTKAKAEKTTKQPLISGVTKSNLNTKDKNDAAQNELEDDEDLSNEGSGWNRQIQ